MSRLYIYALVLVVSAAQAELIDRGGGLIYDSDQDITWMQDANYVVSAGFHPDGKITWDEGIAWADNLTYFDEVRNVVWDDWRLPETATPDITCSVQEDRGPDYPLQSKGYGCRGSEMGYLYNVYQISEADPGPFFGVQKTIYWSRNEFAPDTTRAWWFVYGVGGSQGHFVKRDILTVWAVRDGDVANLTTPLAVEIAVRPGSAQKIVNPGSNGLVSVAVLSATKAADGFEFDALQVDPVTVRIGIGAAAAFRLPGIVRDVDRDGDPDLVMQFRVRETGVACGDKQLAFAGFTYAGEQLVGNAAIKTPDRVCKQPGKSPK